MIPVGWLDPAADCWDTNMLRRLLDGDLHPHGLKVRHHAGYPNTDGACIVLPGRYYAAHTDRINEAIQRYEWLLLVRVSDEEDTFDVSKVEHPRCRIWLQTPRHGRGYGDARLFGVGFPPAFNELPEEPPSAFMDVFLSAQDTHQRRHECFAELDSMDGDIAHWRTEGFTQGLEPKVYRGSMVAAKVAPCPSGAVSVDSFRAWEALESHSVPILDAVSPVDGETSYWDQVLPGVPAPVIRDYKDLSGYIEDQLRDWPRSANRITAWYMRFKRQLALDLVADLRGLGAQ